MIRLGLLRLIFTYRHPRRSHTDADVLSILNAGPRMVRVFKEYRPWRTKEQFIEEIGEYSARRQPNVCGATS